VPFIVNTEHDGEVVARRGYGRAIEVLYYRADLGKEDAAEELFQVASIGHADQPSVSAWFDGWLDTRSLGNAIAEVTSSAGSAGVGGGRRHV
jgi:hypothetical protein